MNFEVKLLLASVLASFIARNIICEELIHRFKVNEDLPIISKVIDDVVEEFLKKEKLRFDVFITSEISHFSLDLLNNCLSKSDRKISIRLLFPKAQRNEYLLLPHSNIVFLNSLDDILNVDQLYKLIRYHNQPIKNIVIIPNLTFNDLNSTRILDFYSKLPVSFMGLFHYAYFITNDMETVTLSTFDWFSPFGCNQLFLHKLNTFNKKSMKWTKKLMNYEKFLQYHGCELIMILPFPSQDKTIYHVSGYASFSATGSLIHNGISTEIFEIASKSYNFKVGYKGVDMDIEWITRQNINFESIKTNPKFFHQPFVYFQTLSLHHANINMRMSNVIADLNVHMFVTPAEKYSPYEKFFLPFDLETWILLGSTFAFTFFIIFIINCFSQSTRSLVYGYKVETPIWNVISIFFGVSQTRLPTKNFSRFILTSFVFFCLIFRTCFQSKFFEFMTSEPRRTPPKEVEDLIDRKYKVYSMNVNAMFSGGFERHERW